MEGIVKKLVPKQAASTMSEARRYFHEAKRGMNVNVCKRCGELFYCHPTPVGCKAKSDGLAVPSPELKFAAAAKLAVVIG